MNPAKKIWTSIVLAAMLVAVMLWWNPSRSSSEAVMQNFWVEKTHDPSKYDVIVYGDSRIYRGFSMDRFLVNSELTGFNYGYVSGSFSPRMLNFIDKHLDTRKSPILILGITPHSLTVNASKDEMFLQEYHRSKTDIWLRKWKGGILRRFDPITPKDLFGLTGNYEEFHYDGWVSNNGKEVDTLAGLETYGNVFINNPIHMELYANLMDYVESKVEEGVKVYAYRPPTMLSMETLENEKTGFDENAFIAEFENRGGQWIEVDREGYQSYDGSHLQKASVLRLMDFIAERVFGSR